MKYEMIFGDQSLFDGAPDDAEYAGWFCQEIRWYMILNGKILFSDGGTWCTSDNPYLSADIAAMRRIIAEPKRWTAEDQKAGRLPEVGCHLLIEGNLAEFIGLSHAPNSWCFRRLDGEWGIQTANKDWFSPIESPEEKAARLREEWCIKALSSCSILSGMQKYELKRLGGYIEDIYDALLSGDLPVPVAPEQNK